MKKGSFIGRAYNVKYYLEAYKVSMPPFINPLNKYSYAGYLRLIISLTYLIKMTFGKFSSNDINR